MTKEIWGLTITGVRGAKTMADMFFGVGYYGKYPVPEFEESLLTGDFSWTGKDIKVCDTPWETFKANSCLWHLFPSPTACYTRVSGNGKFDDIDGSGRVAIYSDQQNCIIWYVNPETGKVYSDRDGDNVVAENVEEFWLRQSIEQVLGLHYLHNNTLPEMEPYCSYVKFYTEEEIEE